MHNNDIVLQKRSGIAAKWSQNKEEAYLLYTQPYFED